MASTALCIDYAPSRPLSASPGPNIVEKLDVITAKSSQPIAVTENIKNRMAADSCSFSIFYPMLPKLKPAIMAAWELMVLRIIVQKLSSLSLILRVFTCKSVNVSFL